MHPSSPPRLLRPFRLVRPDSPLALRGLGVLVGGPEQSPQVPAHGGMNLQAAVQEKVRGFLAYAQMIGLDTRRQVLAFEDDAAAHLPESPIASMCIWVPAPGKTAMLFAPSLSEFPEAAQATELAIRAVLEDARAAGVLVVQAMMEPADAAGKTVFTAAGLSQLATLTYMERRPPAQPPLFDLPPGMSLAPYSAATHGQFHQAIADSYLQTLDCPAMSGMREVEDVIAGHKSVGLFDPQLWSVVLRFGQPVACLLLSEIPARRALELVYLGVSATARGQGLGRHLMQRTLAIAARRQLDLLTLAVDASNVPAVKLYRRCGYTSVAQRVAMIKKL